LQLRTFLVELNCRLDFLEEYGHLKYDAGVEYAYTTLLAVRDSCSKISDGAIEAGRRQASVFVETLEERYKEALESQDTLGEKVLKGIALMDSYLTEFETHAYALKDGTISSYAHEFYEEGLRKYEEGRRKVDEGIEIAKGVVDGGLDKARRARETIETTIEHGVQRALARAKEHGLIHYDDLPEPWRVNPHILKGYRFSEGKWACVRSVVSVHNELVNIWSHLLGFIMVLALAFYFYPSSVNWDMSTKADIFIAGVFFFAACKCLACSTIWHTMSSISEQTLLERFACVDYTGISLLVAASILTTEYTAFYCEPVSRWSYMVAPHLQPRRHGLAARRLLLLPGTDGLPALWPASIHARPRLGAILLLAHHKEPGRVRDGRRPLRLKVPRALVPRLLRLRRLQPQHLAHCCPRRHHLPLHGHAGHVCLGPHPRPGRLLRLLGHARPGQARLR
jgi:adiponectin receptor